MLAFGRPRLFGLVLFCLLSCSSLPANATSVRVNGGAYLGGTADGLTVNAGIFSAFSAAPDGPSTIGLRTIGIPTSISFSPIAVSGPDNAEVSIGSKFTDILNGGITFTGTFTIPASALVTGTFTAPVKMVGQLMAFQDLTLGQGDYTPGPLLASLLFKGRGLATFQGFDVGNNQFLIVSASVAFKGKGNLAVVPEPTSLLLMATGL